jgi:hypothetical protein
MAKPNIKEFMDATGADFLTASKVIYGDVGANMDTRDWGAIMSSDNALQSAQTALADMYSDPAYREANTAYVQTKGYDPAQAYYTYGQMNERVGANYTPTPTEVSAVEDYFEQMGKPDYTWNVPTSTARSTAGASASPTSVTQTNTTGGLTPEIARDLMQRSMTTGVPTSEFDRYGGYDAVQSVYDSNNGTYSLDDFDPGFLDSLANEIANSGVGNLTVLGKTGTPLTEAGRQAMINNGVDWTDDFLREKGIPYEGFLPKAESPIAGGGAGTGIGTSTGINTGGNSGGGGSGLNYLPTAFSGNSSERLGAGNANYQSDLIRSLREADNGFMSQNPGFTRYGYTPPPTSGGGGVSLNAGGAFNPGVLNQDVASADDVANWNNYSTYRTNSLNAKTPITSFEEWLAGGKSSGLPPPAPVVDPSIDWFAQQGGGA